MKSYVLFAKMITNILWHTAPRAAMFVLMVGLERSRGRHLSAAAVSFQSWLNHGIINCKHELNNMLYHAWILDFYLISL